MRKTKAERKARERELAAERAAWAVQFDVATPKYVLEKLGGPSKLREAISLKGTIYNWNGLKVAEETGEPYLNPAPADLGANVERKENAMLKAQELRRKHWKLWSVRGGAKQIAAAEGIKLSTVYAHMVRLRGS